MQTTDKLFMNWNKAHHMMAHRAHPAMDHGPQSMMHRGQGRLLSIIAESQPIGQKDLVEKLDIRPSSLSELLKKLEAKKLVVRTADENDKRNMLVSLTEEGKTAAQEASRRIDDISGKIFGVLSPEEQEQLNALLEKLVGAWEGDTGEMPPGGPHIHDRHFPGGPKGPGAHFRMCGMDAGRGRPDTEGRWF